MDETTFFKLKLNSFLLKAVKPVRCKMPRYFDTHIGSVIQGCPQDFVRPYTTCMFGRPVGRNVSKKDGLGVHRRTLCRKLVYFRWYMVHHRTIGGLGVLTQEILEYWTLNHAPPETFLAISPLIIVRFSKFKNSLKARNFLYLFM